MDYVKELCLRVEELERKLIKLEALIKQLQLCEKGNEGEI